MQTANPRDGTGARPVLFAAPVASPRWPRIRGAFEGSSTLFAGLGDRNEEPQASYLWRRAATH
jgi:hypothetical protein